MPIKRSNKRTKNKKNRIKTKKQQGGFSGNYQIMSFNGNNFLEYTAGGKYSSIFSNYYIVVLPKTKYTKCWIPNCIMSINKNKKQLTQTDIQEIVSTIEKQNLSTGDIYENGDYRDEIYIEQIKRGYNLYFDNIMDKNNYDFWHDIENHNDNSLPPESKVSIEPWGDEDEKDTPDETPPAIEGIIKDTSSYYNFMFCYNNQQDISIIRGESLNKYIDQIFNKFIFLKVKKPPNIPG